MDWLLSSADDGCFYRTGEHESLVNALTHTVERLLSEGPDGRLHRAERAIRLSYGQIIAEVLGALDQMPG